MINNISVRILTYDGAERVDKLLFTMKECWKDFSPEITVVEDPCPRVENTAKIYEITKRYGVNHILLSEWGDIQGTAKMAMESAPDGSWVFILPDDILVTRDTLSDLDRWISIIPDNVAGIQPVHFDYHASFNRERPDFYGMMDEWWSPDIKFFSPFQCEVIHGFYGSGFVLKKSVWQELGFSPDWYAYDIDIGRRVYMCPKEYIIARCLTAPIIHLGGAAQASRDHYAEVIRDSVDRVFTQEQISWCREKFLERKEKYNSTLTKLRI